MWRRFQHDVLLCAHISKKEIFVLLLLSPTLMQASWNASLLKPFLIISEKFLLRTISQLKPVSTSTVEMDNASFHSLMKPQPCWET